MEEKLKKTVQKRYQEIKELETLANKTGLQSKSKLDGVRKDALNLNVTKSKTYNSPSPKMKLRHTSDKSSNSTSNTSGSQKKGQKRGQKSASIGSKKEIKDEEKASLERAKAILMKEFHRRNKIREKSKLTKRTNHKLEALHRFKKFSQPFLNPDKADPNEELKNRVQKKDLQIEKEERTRKILESVTEEDPENAKETEEINEVFEDTDVKEEEIKETKKEKDFVDTENDIPIQRKTKIVRKVSSTDGKVSAAQEQANKYLQALQEKKKTKGKPTQKIKFDEEAYSRVNNPDSKKSLEDQKRLQSLISETASFSQMMETA